MTDGAPPLGNLVTAQLARVEIALLARVLATTLAGALPAAMVDVEWKRSVADRLARRPGVVVGVRMLAQQRELTLRVRAVGAVETSVTHVVRGVVLSRSEVTVAEWLDELGAVLTKIAADDEAARIALERALTG